MSDDSHNDFKRLKILILEGYSRQSLPLIRAFKKLGCEVSALCNSKLDVAYASKYTDHKILGICDRDRTQDTTECVRQLLIQNSYDLVVPTVDFSACILSKNKAEFSQYTRVASNDWEVYDIAADKLKTMEVCIKNNLPCPITIQSANNIEDLLKAEITYPIIMKPRIGYGAIGFKKIISQDHLIEYFTKMDVKIQDFVFQEYIPHTGLQYECAMFVDNKNEVKTSLVFSKNRWFPIEGGSSTLNITIKYPDIVEDCTRLLQLINWRWVADIDLIQDPRDNKVKILEINPRVSGSVKICFEAGVDQAIQILQMAFGKEVNEYKSYKENQRLRCSQTDLLWFLKSKNRFNTNPSWFSLKNTKDHTFYLDDPLPWFAFSLQGITRVHAEMKKRKS